MATIVEKLQQAAMDADTPDSDLLRRVKFAAVMLSVYLAGHDCQLTALQVAFVP